MSDLPPPPAAAPTASCSNCGAPVRPDQDWCLSCGAAVTTEVAGASGWRTPIAIVAAVLLLAVGGLVFAFVELSGEAGTVASAPVEPTTAPTGPSGPSGTSGPSGATGPSGPTGTPGPVEGAETPTPSDTTAVGRWPAGEDAYTVILFSETSFAAARSKAQTVSSLPGVGILNSSRFSTLRSGYFVVFSDQYDTLEDAQDAAEEAEDQAPGAYAKQVTPK